MVSKRLERVDLPCTHALYPSNIAIQTGKPRHNESNPVISFSLCRRFSECFPEVFWLLDYLFMITMGIYLFNITRCTTHSRKSRRKRSQLLFRRRPMGPSLVLLGMVLG